MIESVTVIGVNGSQVQINLSDNIYPLEHFEVTYDVVADDESKQQSHGTWQSPDYIGNAHLLMEGKLSAQTPADYWAKHFAFTSPFIPMPQLGYQETCQVIVQLSGWGDSLSANANLDGGMPSPPLTTDIPMLSDWQVNLKLRDPRWYSATVQGVTLGAPTGTDGITLPATFPITFTGSQASTGAALNLGNAYSDPIWTINGPCNDPKLYAIRANGTTDMWGLTGVYIPQGSSVLVDFKANSVIQDGTYSLYKYVSSSSKWWELFNGVNQVGFTAFNTDADTAATCNWQNAYFI